MSAHRSGAARPTRAVPRTELVPAAIRVACARAEAALDDARSGVFVRRIEGRRRIQEDLRAARRGEAVGARAKLASDGSAPLHAGGFRVGALSFDAHLGLGANL